MPAAALHAALLTLWPAGVPHASSAAGVSSITLIAARPPAVATATVADRAEDEGLASKPLAAGEAREQASKPPSQPPTVSPAPVDMVAQPRSAPDIATLQGLPFSGLPMHVRLTIDSTGHVVEVDMLRSTETAVVNEGLRRMFLATAFVPARRGGVDVASVQDIEISLADLQ